MAAILLLSGIPAAPQAQRGAPQSQRIEIKAQIIESFDPRNTTQTQFGALRFRGGMVLSSPASDFGGLSALRMSADGNRFVALTDRAYWLRARMVYRGTAPVAIADAELAPVLGPDGRHMAKHRGGFDTEALADDGNTMYVGIERSHRILRFDFGRDGVRARGRPVPAPSAMKALPSNRGIECMVMPPRGKPLAGTLIAISERGLDPAGNIVGFLIGPRGGTFSVRRTDEFDVSDCALTPGGDLLILERRFSWMRGLAIRIRSVPLTRIAPGAVLDGPQVLFADMAQQIDNFEGLSVHRAPDGATVLTLISDDNFSSLQRTILLQFALIGE